MDAVINEKTLDGQFDTVEDFCENLENDIIKIFKHFKKIGNKIYKIGDIFDYQVTSDYKLSEIFNMCTKKNPAIQRLKSLIADIMHEPFLNEKYENCFEFAKDSNCALISFTHVKFRTDYITYDKCTILNCYNNNSTLDHLYDSLTINDEFYYENIEKGIKISFMSIGKRRYTQEAFDNCGLDNKDKRRIREKMNNLIGCFANGTPLTDVGKRIENNLWEFRVDVSHGRIFRIFFLRNTNEVIFLNGFIKKTQKTPTLELSMARNLVKQYNH